MKKSRDGRSAAGPAKGAGQSKSAPHGGVAEARMQTERMREKTERLKNLRLARDAEKRG